MSRNQLIRGGPICPAGYRDGKGGQKGREERKGEERRGEERRGEGRRGEGRIRSKQMNSYMHHNKTYYQTCSIYTLKDTYKVDSGKKWREPAFILLFKYFIQVFCRKAKLVCTVCSSGYHYKEPVYR